MTPTSRPCVLNFRVASGATVALEGGYLEACIARTYFAPRLLAVGLAFEVYVLRPIVYRDGEDWEETIVLSEELQFK